jgi:hypothetical protein
MSYYEESMAGLQQIMDALFGQAQQVAPIEVDELQMGQQQIAQALGAGAPMGQDVNTGVDAMQRAMRAAGTKEKKIPQPYTGGAPRGF